MEKQQSGIQMLIAVWNSMRIYGELHGEKFPAHMQEDIFVYHCIAKHHALLQAILPPEPRPNRRLSQAKQSWLSEFFYNLIYGHLAQTYDYWFVYWEKREHKQLIKHLRKDLSSPFPRLSIGKKHFLSTSQSWLSLVLLQITISQSSSFREGMDSAGGWGWYIMVSLCFSLFLSHFPSVLLASSLFSLCPSMGHLQP